MNFKVLATLSGKETVSYNEGDSIGRKLEITVALENPCERWSGWTSPQELWLKGNDLDQ